MYSLCIIEVYYLKKMNSQRTSMYFHRVDINFNFFKNSEKKSQESNEKLVG